MVLFGCIPIAGAFYCIQNKKKAGQEPKGVAWLAAGALCCFCGGPTFAWIPFAINSMYSQPRGGYSGGYGGHPGVQIQQQPPPHMMQSGYGQPVMVGQPVIIGQPVMVAQPVMVGQPVMAAQPAKPYQGP